ncbi:MAG: hypothetical protein M9904_11920 [Chitinophagaceae bacterium]|nr:hypothetical protein [Chitinophagaceae bacterium]
MKKIFLLPVMFFLFASNGCMHTKKAAASLSFAPNIVVAHRGAWKKQGFPRILLPR